MTKIVLKDGTEEYLSPGAARAKVAAGEATFDQFVPTYSTRQVVAEVPAKAKRKRRSKAEIEADKRREEETSTECDADEDS